MSVKQLNVDQINKSLIFCIAFLKFSSHPWTLEPQKYYVQNSFEQLNHPRRLREGSETFKNYPGFSPKKC